MNETEVLKYADVYPDNAGKIAQKLHIKKDDIELIRKGYVDKDGVKIDPKDERSIIATVSTEDRDRDGQVVKMNGIDMDSYQKNPVLMWAHRYAEPPIGTMVWSKLKDDRLVMKFRFAKTEFADQIYQLYCDKILKAFSIGFAVGPDGYDEDEKTFNKISLLEVSATPIPANQNALVMEAYQKGVIRSDKLIKDLGIEEVEAEAKAVSKAVSPDKGEAKEVVTKPETTDAADDGYHRIPVDDEDHADHKIRTISVSEKKGIKALYCVTCKKVITYMFSTDKWTMEEAQEWVDSHKAILERHARAVVATGQAFRERWNKSLSKIFDVDKVDSSPSSFELKLLEKFLECKTREIVQTTHFIPSPLLGMHLAGIKAVLKDFKLMSTRCFSWDGRERPPAYEVIRLSSKESDDFLISGTEFYDADGVPLAVNFTPVFMGLEVAFSTAKKHKEWNKGLLANAMQWARDHNKLKGEKFALNGEFLGKTEDDFSSLILEAKSKRAIFTTAQRLEKQGQKAKSRGMLFVGPPGTGKTKTGRVLMNELDATFIWVSSRDFERVDPIKALSLSFSMARDLAPSVLFLEDIDTWLKSYTIDLLKTELDGVQQNDGVLTVLTSNFPEKLPDALIDRPGRFHHVLSLSLPAQEQRQEMIEKWAGEIDTDIMSQILEQTDGYSGAHMKELVEYAQMLAEDDESIDLEDALILSLEMLKEQKELIEALRKQQKSTDEFIAKTLEKDIVLENIPFPEVKDVDADGEIVTTDEGEIQVVNGEELADAESKDEDVIQIDVDAEPEKQEIDIEAIEQESEDEAEAEDKEVAQPEIIELDEKEAESEDEAQEIMAETAKDTEPPEDFNEAEKEPDDKADMKEMSEILGQLQSDLAELKEGRVLSSRSRRIVKNTIESLDSLKANIDDALAELKRLFEATEPKRIEGDKEIDLEKIQIEPVETEEKSEDINIEVLDAEAIKEHLSSTARDILTDPELLTKVRETIKIELARQRGELVEVTE